MAKKKNGPVLTETGIEEALATGEWVYTDGPSGVNGTKVFEPGLIREVTGVDLDTAVACAEELDRFHAARAQGTKEQNEAIAARLHAEADKVAEQ